MTVALGMTELGRTGNDTSGGIILCTKRLEVMGWKHCARIKHVAKTWNRDDTYTVNTKFFAQTINMPLDVVGTKLGLEVPDSAL